MRANIMILAILAASTQDAWAGGHRRCRRPSRHAPVVLHAPPVYYPQPAATGYAALPPPPPARAAVPPAPAQVQAAPNPLEVLPAPASGPPDQPLYTYEADQESGGAYYYTYNDSGELVVKQWMDWLFRGGRRAGMPAPPLPIVGRLLD